MAKPRKTVGYGYVGEWRSGNLGWFLPQHLEHNPSRKFPANRPPVFPWNRNATGVLCRITIEEVLDPKVRRKHRAVSP
jgi:hypothetical protein